MATTVTILNAHGNSGNNQLPNQDTNSQKPPSKRSQFLSQAVRAMEANEIKKDQAEHVPFTQPGDPQEQQIAYAQAQNFLGASRVLTTSSEGHNAVGTKLIAAMDDGQIGLMNRFRLRQRGPALHLRNFFPIFFIGFKKLRKLLIIIGSKNDI